MKLRRLGVVLYAVGLVAAEPAVGEEAHLPFFHANRDWVLRRLEALDHKQTGDLSPAQAWSFDPFADESAYARLRAAQAALDSAGTVGDLGAFRAALDSVLAATLQAGARLDSLDRTFARHLRTALEVTLSLPAGLAVDRVEARLDGRVVQDKRIDPLERAALQAGGVLQIVRRVVEPRAQMLEVRAFAPDGTASATTALLVAPAPDRLEVVHLALESLQAPARAERASLGGGN